MNKIFAISKKELTSFFNSPTATIVLVVTISSFNVFFYLIIGERKEASLHEVFKVMEFFFIFIIPILTMGVFSEEKRSGTMEFLMTTPTTNTEIVIGKFLGSLGFFTVLMGITLVYYPIIEFFGSPDRLAMLSGYVGLWLEGALFIAIGLLASSLTHSQLIAAIVSYAILFTLYFSTVFTKFLSESSEDLLTAFTTASHSQNFAVGLITPGDLTYYLAGIAACIFLARVHIENRSLE
jgi:ABC-2 type transport system permease protein